MCWVGVVEESYRLSFRSKMGSMLAQNQRLFVHEWTPPSPNDLYCPVRDLSLLPTPLPGRILLPVSKLSQRRKFVLDNHRNVVLIQDVPQLEARLAVEFQGIPVVREEEVGRCGLQLRNGCEECGVPVVLEKFHESYVQNYLNAFLFYGVRVWAYDRVDHYLRSECANPYLVCSSFQLQQLASRGQQLTQIQRRSRLTILCFCNKAQYSLPKKTEFLLQKYGIDYQLFPNMLEIIDRLASERLTLGSPGRTERVLLYLNEKEKEIDYLVKMARRAERSIRNLKVLKVFNHHTLLQKLQKTDYAIVILSNDAKEMRNELEMHEALEEQALEDRVILLRRDAEMGEKFIHRVQSVTGRPKYVQTSILSKPIIFYGSLEMFKYVLRHFPHLQFKKFIDSNKETAQLRRFLPFRTEVVMTHLKVCACNEQYGPILCTVIHVRSKANTFKAMERVEGRACGHEGWVSEEWEVLQRYGRKGSGLYRLNFNYPLRKMSYIGKIINEIFLKFKEKKTILHNTIDNSIFLFSCEHYTIDQLTNFLIKFFTNKYLANYDNPCLFQHLKYLLFAEMTALRDVKTLEQDLFLQLEADDSLNIFQFSKKLVELLIQHPLFLEEVNNIWSLLLHQDRAEYLNSCQVLFFLLFLGFNKANFAHYCDETLEGLLLVVRPNTISYDQEEVAAFTLKSRSSFVYNLDFLICEQVEPGQVYPGNPIIIRVQGNELTNFNLYLPLWKSKRQVIIPPFTKFELNNKPHREYLLKLSLNSQQKLLDKFSQHFLQENVGQLKLMPEEREMRKLDVFLESMSHGKYETAGYMLKKLMKEEAILNGDLMNAYAILYHLKKGEVELAEGKLRQDKYYRLLHTAIAAVREGHHPSQKAFPSVCNSNKRIQESTKEYQNLEDTEQESDSAEHSAMISTDPEMIRKLTSDYKLINYRVEKGRSPSYVLRSLAEPRKTKSNCVPILIGRPKDPASTSLADAISSHHSIDKGSMKITISPPVRISSSSADHKPANGNMMGVSTFGNNFRQEGPVCEKRDSREGDRREKGELAKLVSTRSESKSEGERGCQFEDPINEDLPSLSRKSSSIKQSLFLQMEIQKAKDNPSQINPIDHKGTATFNFRPEQPPPSNQDDQEEEIIESDHGMEGMDLVQEVQSQRQSQPSQKNILKYSASDLDYFKFNLSTNGSRLFPIKRKLNRIPKKSFNFGFTPHQPKSNRLNNIDEETSSQLSQSNNLKSPLKDSASKDIPLGKENKSCLDSARTNTQKLFTFCRNEERRSQILSENGTGLFNNLSGLTKKSSSKTSKVEVKNPLFFVFDEEENNSLIEMKSISSIELEEAEQVHPEEEEQPQLRR